MLFGGRVELTMSGSTRLVLGCLLCDLFIDGNLIGSLMKKIGYTESGGGLRQLFKKFNRRRTVLLKTQSWFPSSVYSFMAQPWTSRAVSAEPRSSPTVETLRRTGVFFPTLFKKLAEVMSVQSLVTSNSPYALFIPRESVFNSLNSGFSFSNVPGSLGMDDTEGSEIC